jgi:hypothetical protein
VKNCEGPAYVGGSSQEAQRAQSPQLHAGSASEPK